MIRNFDGIESRCEESVLLRSKKPNVGSLTRSDFMTRIVPFLSALCVLFSLCFSLTRDSAKCIYPYMSEEYVHIHFSEKMIILHYLSEDVILVRLCVV